MTSKHGLLLRIAAVLSFSALAFVATLAWLRGVSEAYRLWDYLIDWPTIIAIQWRLPILAYIRPVTNAFGWAILVVAAIFMGSLVVRLISKISAGVAAMLFTLMMICAVTKLAKGIGAGTPTDDNMLAIFQEHQSEFESLLNMLAQDHGLKVVAWDRTDPADPSVIGISTARINLYRSLCSRIGVKGIYNDAPEGLDKAVDFTVTNNPYFDGSSKGYLYGHLSTSDIVSNLDELVAEKRRLDARIHYSGYRNINDQWQLYYIN